MDRRDFIALAGGVVGLGVLAKVLPPAHPYVMLERNTYIGDCTWNLQIKAGSYAVNKNGAHIDEDGLEWTTIPSVKKPLDSYNI